MPKKYTYAQIQSKINKMGLTLVSKEYKNGAERIDVMCKACDHMWKPTFYNLLRGSRCPKCYGNVPYDEHDVRQILLSRNIILLSKYVNNRTKLIVRCGECENEWYPTFKNINIHNQGCPVCNTGKSQRKLYNIVRSIYPEYYILNNFRDFDWLINTKTKRKQEIDILVHNDDWSFVLAIEYDGQQHFIPMRYANAKDKFKKTIELDKLKEEKILSRIGKDITYFVRINYKDSIDYDNVVRIFKENGVPE